MIIFLRILKSKLSSSFRFNTVKAIVFFLCLLWYTTSGFIYFEMEFKPDLGWVDGIWWSLVTMATVGYGDLFPTTMQGRLLVGVPAMVFGIGFLGYLITTVATKLVDAKSRKLQGMNEAHMKNHAIIFNYTHLDELITLVNELRADSSMKNKGVCLIDEALAEIPQRLADLDVHFVKGNPTDEETLTRAGLADASHAIVLSKDRRDSHSDDQNLVTVMVIEKLHPGIFTIVEVIDKRKKHQFELAGANDLICLGELAVSLITREILDPGINAVLQELTSNAYGSEMYIVPLKSSFTSYKELLLAGVEKNISVIGLIRDGKPLMNCAHGEKLAANDKAVIVGCDRIASL